MNTHPRVPQTDDIPNARMCACGREADVRVGVRAGARVRACARGECFVALCIPLFQRVLRAVCLVQVSLFRLPLNLRTSHTRVGW